MTNQDQSNVRLRRPDRLQVSMRMECDDDLLPAKHQARDIWAAVGMLDLSTFHQPIKARDGMCGRDATDPRLLIALWLYAATRGVGSARELARLCTESRPYRWLCGGVSLNHHTLGDFRVGHEAALDELLTQLLAVLVHQGLVKVQRLSQDGVRVRACAGRSSFRREQTLEKLKVEAQQHLAALKQQADDASRPPRTRAAQERGAADRLRRIEAALALLPQAQAAKERHTGKKSRQQPARVSTTDPEAHYMKTGSGAILPAYNIQLATDTASRAIVGVIVGNSGSDAQYAQPMRTQAQQRTGQQVKEHLMDGGYFNKDSLELAQQQEVAVYMPLPKAQEGKADPALPKRGDGPGTVEWRERMIQEVAQQIYKQRASTSETVNADLGTHRGLSRLLVRGINKVKCVVLFSVLAYNLMHFGSALLS